MTITTLEKDENDNVQTICSIERNDEKIVYYPSVINNQYINNNILALSMVISFLTKHVYRTEKYFKNQRANIVIYIKKDILLCFKKKIIEKHKTYDFKENIKDINLDCKKGSLVFIGVEKQKIYELPENNNIIIFYEFDFSKIYKKIPYRISYAKKIKKNLQEIKSLEDWNQTIQNKLKLSIIGQGCFGNVYKTDYLQDLFAIKFSKVETKKIFNKEDPTWRESNILRSIIYNYIIEKRCPNFPLVYDFLTCDSELTIKDKKGTYPCVAILLELASGDICDFFKKMDKNNIQSLECALFQIMAALHCMQHNDQIIHCDIKKQNILYYNIQPGGCWRYKIMDKYYYIPNYGTLFILNDFGVSKTLSPKYNMFNKDKKIFLGSRSVMLSKINGKDILKPILIKNKKYKKSKWPSQLSKIKWEDGSPSSYSFEFFRDKDFNIYNTDCIDISPDIKKISSADFNNIDFYEDPSTFPPLEFYNDTQDVLRSFIGGKRTMQPGNHGTVKEIPKEFIKRLEPYLGKASCLKDMKGIPNEPKKVLAGHFIESFFYEYTTNKKNLPIIEKYVIS